MRVFRDEGVEFFTGEVEVRLDATLVEVVDYRTPNYVEGAFFYMGVEALGTGEGVDQGKEMGYSGIHICAHVVF